MMRSSYKGVIGAPATVWILNSPPGRQTHPQHHCQMVMVRVWIHIGPNNLADPRAASTWVSGDQRAGRGGEVDPKS